MKKDNLIYFFLAVLLSLTSCVSQKKYTAMQEMRNDLQEELAAQRMRLDECQQNRADTNAKLSSLQATNEGLRDRIKDLNTTNVALLNNTGDLATLSKKAAENLERSLESMKEKDLQIKSLRDAVNKRDSVTLALVTSIKGALGNLNDEDIEVNVE